MQKPFSMRKLAVKLKKLIKTKHVIASIEGAIS